MAEKTNSYINPMTGFGYSHLLAGEANQDILISLINVVFKGEKSIIDIIYGPEQDTVNREEHKKALFGFFSEQCKNRHSFAQIQAAGMAFFREGHVHSLSCMIQQKLPALKEEKELFTDLDKWAYLLTHMHQLNKVPEQLDYGVFQKIFKLSELDGLGEEKLRQYKLSLKDRSAYKQFISYSKKLYKQSDLEEALKKWKKSWSKRLKKPGIESLNFCKIVEIAIEMREEGFTIPQIMNLIDSSMKKAEGFSQQN